MSALPEGFDPDAATVWTALDNLQPHPANPKNHDLPRLQDAMRRLGFMDPLVVDQRTGLLIAGHGRREALQAMRDAGEDPPSGIRTAEGQWLVPVFIGWQSTDDDEALTALVALNRLTETGGWHTRPLVELLERLSKLDAGMTGTGYQAGDLTMLREKLADLDANRNAKAEAFGNLAKKFGVPPTTVLDSRQGYWRDRKRTWLALGIQSELGRGDAEWAASMRDTLNTAAYGRRRVDANSNLTGASSVPDYAQGQGLALMAPGTSVFDPVLAELACRWWAPPEGGTVLDPFAGGSVRGIVAGLSGLAYHGVDLRPEQVAANELQAAELWGEPLEDHTPELTDVELVAGVWVKRDDTYVVAGQAGGKVRSCWHIMSTTDAPGVITAGSRQSPQVAIVAALAARLGLPCRVHVPSGADTPQTLAAAAHGAEVVRHTPGYNTVIVARAREDAAESGWLEVPFGMECQAAVEQTATQVANLPDEVERLVVPVGSGMSLAGILHGLRAAGRELPVVGIVVGSDPTDRLDAYAPEGWRHQVELVESELDYHDHAPVTSWHGVPLDPVYEAKCLPYLSPGDCLWIVGRRAVEQVAEDTGTDLPAQARPIRFRLSAAWATKPLDCTVDGITRDGGCGGGCCTAPSYWPPMSNPDESTTACAHLGPDGCTMGPEDRPAQCLLYPLVPNDRDTLVMHNRGITGTCAACWKQGPPLVDALYDNLVELFGEDQAAAAREAVHAGEDAELVAPPAVAYAIRQEHAWQADNTVPEPRSAYVPDLPGLTEVPEAPTPRPRWYAGDATDLDAVEGLPDQVDLVLTCPPYYDLEVYSDDPADLSNAGDYDTFVELLATAMDQSAARLRDGGFAVWVVGDVRGPDGGYRQLTADTMRVARAAGLTLYNHLVYLEPLGTVPLRAGRLLTTTRKVSKVHQDVLVFVKGDPAKAGRGWGVPAVEALTGED